MANKKERSTNKAVKTSPSPVTVQARPAVEAAKANGAAATTAVVVARPEPALRELVARDRSAVIALMNRLRDADAEVARDAAQTLASLPADAEAIDALCAVVVNADGYFHPVVRAAAAAALGQLGDRRAVEALIQGTRDTMAEASEEAIKALGLLGDARALVALQVVIRNENGFFLEHVRRTAETAAGRIGLRA